MIEREIDVTTPDGVMTTFVFHPTYGGPHPVVLYLMDAPSIRPALKDMATRLASVGYYVLLPYLFYRGGPYREFGLSDEDMHARRELMETVSPAGIVVDAQALLAVAADDPAAGAGPVGAVGFCMSGGLTVALARAFPDRVAAAASIHGAWLVRATPRTPLISASTRCGPRCTSPGSRTTRPRRRTPASSCATCSRRPTCRTPWTSSPMRCTASRRQASATTGPPPSSTGSGSTRCCDAGCDAWRS